MNIPSPDSLENRNNELAAMAKRKYLDSYNERVRLNNLNMEREKLKQKEEENKLAEEVFNYFLPIFPTLTWCRSNNVFTLCNYEFSGSSYLNDYKDYTIKNRYYLIPLPRYQSRALILSLEDLGYFLIRQDKKSKIGFWGKIKNLFSWEDEGDIGP